MIQYDLAQYVTNGYIMYEIRKGLYGLVQAGRLANDQLVEHLETFQYYPAKNTPGLFSHLTRPISFTLCVDDFGVKYTNTADVDHLIAALKTRYRITIDWTGQQYLGLTLAWDYIARHVDCSMPGYIERTLHRFHHPAPNKPQHSPHAWTAPHYGAPTQYAESPDTSTPLSASNTTLLQQILGTLLYYARAVDNTLLVAINTLASTQTKGTEATLTAAVQLLNYCATHPDAIIRFVASDMTLHIHSDASYLLATNARSRLFLPKKRPRTFTPQRRLSASSIQRTHFGQ